MTRETLESLTDPELFAAGVCAGVCAWRPFENGDGSGEVLCAGIAYCTQLGAHYRLPDLHENLRAEIISAVLAPIVYYKAVRA